MGGQSRARKECDLLNSLFLIFAGFNYEGNRLLSTHMTVEQAITEVERLTKSDQCFDHIEVRAVAPGPGCGITVASWQSEYIDNGGPDVEFVWHRQF